MGYCKRDRQDVVSSKESIRDREEQDKLQKRGDTARQAHGSDWSLGDHLIPSETQVDSDAVGSKGFESNYPQFSIKKGPIYS